MKIYINNFNLTILNNLQKTLAELLVETNIYSEVYTNESIYHIDKKNIFYLEPKDGEITVHKNYFNNITLIVDESYFEKTQDTSILGSEHIHKTITKRNYRLHPKSKINLVIEIADINTPNDIYFQTEERIDVKDIFVKQEIIEFLSLLN
jgi:hypothetical protein